MNRPIVVLGVGQLGRLFGGAALRLSRPVLPITRSTDPREVWRASPEDVPILVTVDEASLPEVLGTIPAGRRRHVVLVQNELFASSWSSVGYREATVLAFWTLCKPGQPLLVASGSGVHGPHAALVAALHEALEIPCRVLGSAGERDAELAAKYAFILTINALGVLADRSIGEWMEDGERVEMMMRESLVLGGRLAGVETPGDDALARVGSALERMSEVPARGRSAPARVRRALAHAQRLGVRLPMLEEVGASLGEG